MKPFAAFVFVVLLIVSSRAGDADIAPVGINLHFNWCDKAKNAAAKLKRYEGFWKQHHPEREDEYNDQSHVRYVRKCAYRLIALYAQTGQSEKCLKMLKWLESNDDVLRETEETARGEN